MKRAAVVTLWLAAGSMPALAATVFFFGCCVLPFHRLMHKVAPVCSLVMRLGSTDDAAKETSTPAREKQQPVKRIAADVSRSLAVKVRVVATALSAPAAASAYRSFITLGALRCDQDVGLYALIDTYRI